MEAKLNLTIEQAVHAHRFMWNWIADKTLEKRARVTKTDFIAEFGITRSPIYSCYACDYALSVIGPTCILDMRCKY